MSLKSNLGIGPMSSEIIESVYRYSNYYRKELMLIATKNQIDHDKGYVNNWSTIDYLKFIKLMRERYPNSSIKLCRDHCGPGFNGVYDLEDSYKTIKSDIENGFDLIHIDFCNLKADKETKLEESKEAIEYCLKLNPNIILEVGTDENTGTKYSIPNIAEIEEEISFFTKFCKPEFYVIQTGSLVKEISQIGDFNKSFIENALKILKGKDLKLKEHNADYLTKEGIMLREGFVDAMNIAPQLGVVQTQLVLNKCLIYGIKIDEFLDEVYEGEKWKKWMHNNSEDNKFLCSIIAGHYHFTSDKYKKLIEELEKREDIHETIIKTIMDVIDHYERR